MYRGAVVMEFRCNALPSYCNTQKMPTSQAEADVQEVVDLLSRLSEESLGCCHFRRQNWGGGGACWSGLVRRFIGSAMLDQHYVSVVLIQSSTVQVDFSKGIEHVPVRGLKV